MISKIKGFTLIEVLMVILIVGILASLAMPQYTKVVEKAKVAEARTILTALRTAEGIYFAENDEYTTDISLLGVDIDTATAKFDYIIASVSLDPPEFIATSTRKGGKYDGETLSMSQTGTLTGSSKYVELLGISAS